MAYIQKASANALIIAVLALALLSSVGCSSKKWTMLTSEPMTMQWPPAPNPAKASYQGEIKGFKQIGRSLMNLLTGRINEAAILKPVAIAVGVDGRMAIADMQRKGVHYYVPSTQKYDFLYKAQKTNLQSPVGLCFDNDQFLYVSDSVLGQILVFDTQGKCTKIIDYAGKTPLDRPTGLAFDRANNLLYVADTRMHMVHVYDAHKGYLKTIGNRGAENEEFNFPTHIGLDNQGRLLVNDTMNFKLKIFDSNNEFVRAFGRHGDGSGDFAMSKGVAVDNWGIIYVVDALFDNIQLFNEEGEFLLTIGGRGQGIAEFWLPTGLFIDQENRLYICDTYNHRIQIFQLYDNKKSNGAA